MLNRGNPPTDYALGSNLKTVLPRRADVLDKQRAEHYGPEQWPEDYSPPKKKSKKLKNCDKVFQIGTYFLVYFYNPVSYLSN